MTRILKWRRLSFGCGLRSLNCFNSASVGAGFGSAEEIPGRRAFPLGRRCATTFEETSRLPGTLGRPSQPGPAPSAVCGWRLPPPTQTTVARRPSPAPPPIARHEARTAHTPPHSIFAAPHAWARATPVRAASPAAERVRKPTRLTNRQLLRKQEGGCQDGGSRDTAQVFRPASSTLIPSLLLPKQLAVTTSR